jgi:zinc transporter ZupT
LFGDYELIHGLNASLLAAGISTAGIIAAASFGAWVQKNSAYFSAFAVGLLTVAVIFHLIPEAFYRSSSALSWVTVGFAAMVLIGMGVQASVRGREQGVALTFGYASIIALAAHSLLDGVIYAASFQEEPFTGWLATGGLLFHEFPEGVIAFYLLFQAGLGRVRSILIAFGAASLTTVAGTVGANEFLNMTGGLPLAAMLGSAAGALIYVLIFHLGPHAAQAPKRRGYLIAGIGVIVGITAVILNSLAGA